VPLASLAEERKFAAITQDLTLDARTANHDGGITKVASKVGWTSL